MSKVKAGIASRQIVLGIFAFVVGILIADPVPAYAEPQYLPSPLQIALPAEREVLGELLNSQAFEENPKPELVLKALDEALTKLPQPTKMRGFVQFLRSSALFSQNNQGTAIIAVEESIRLLPGYSAPLIAAASVFAYSDHPGRGADYLLRASTEDPDTVRTVSDYEINNLLTRLRLARDERRLRALSNRLVEIDWVGSELGSGSSLARDVIKLRLKDGDVAGARTLIPRLVVPAHFYELLMDKAAQPIWPEIEAWAGPRLERQWPIYLKEARSRWMATKDSATVGDYLSALLSAGHDDTIIRQIYPLFNGADKLADYYLIFAVVKVAAPLARKGRWAEVDALFGRAQTIWPLGEHANALNVAANRSRYLLEAGRFKDALTQIDVAIADTRKWGSEVNSDAISTMHYYRACTLQALGRAAEADISVALATKFASATAQAGLYLCMNDVDAARRALIAGLSAERDRQGVLTFVQMPDRETSASDYARSLRAKTDALRRDRKLLAEVAKFGRILPFRLEDGAPLESSAP